MPAGRESHSTGPKDRSAELRIIDLRKQGLTCTASPLAGKPIPPTALAHLFQPFHRDAVLHHREGLGLGLYIAHEIAKAHRGTLDVQSTEEETRFTFRMPVS